MPSFPFNHCLLLKEEVHGVVDKRHWLHGFFAELMTDSIAKIAYIPERVVRLAGCIARSLEVIRSMHSEEVQCKCVIPNHAPVGIFSWIQYMQCIRMMLISIVPKEKLMCTAVASFTFLPVLQVAFSLNVEICVHLPFSDVHRRARTFRS